VKVLVVMFIEITSVFLAKVVRMNECCRLHDRGEKEDLVKYVLFSIEHIVIFVQLYWQGLSFDCVTVRDTHN